MKKNHASWISYALTGAGIGFPVTVLCMTLIGGFNQATRELLIWLAASVLFGVTSGLFFENKSLKLLWAILPVFLLIYIVVYLVVFLAMKLEAKKINKTLDAE